MWSLRIPVAVLVVTELAGLISCSDSTSQTETQRRDNSFDIYIFTLHWPYTTCLDWRESGHGHKCNKIGKKQFIFDDADTYGYDVLFRVCLLECARPVAHEDAPDRPQLLQQLVALRPRPDGGHHGRHDAAVAGRGGARRHGLAVVARVDQARHLRRPVCQ